MEKQAAEEKAMQRAERRQRVKSRFQSAIDKIFNRDKSKEEQKKEAQAQAEEIRRKLQRGETIGRPGKSKKKIGKTSPRITPSASAPATPSSSPKNHPPGPPVQAIVSTAVVAEGPAPSAAEASNVGAASEAKEGKVAGAEVHSSQVVTIPIPPIPIPKEGEESGKNPSTRYKKSPRAMLLARKFLSPPTPPPQPKIPKCRRPIFHVVNSNFFKFFIMFLIIVNTIVLAADHHPISYEAQENLEALNFALTILFTLEMILKLWGLGLRGYTRDTFNIFDALIVLVSLTELIVAPPGFFTPEVGDSGGSGAISALRTFRLFRVFKLARSWRSFSVLLKTMGETLRDIGNFAVLLLLFMYIFALVGMQFFANQFCFDQRSQLPEGQGKGCDWTIYSYPRSNFDNLLRAFVTVFQVLTGENWNTVMYDAWRSSGGASVIYFIALVVLGNFIVLNLFLAILLGNFEGMEELLSTPAEKNKSSTSFITRILTSWKSSKKVTPTVPQPAEVPELGQHSSRLTLAAQRMYSKNSKIPESVAEGSENEAADSTHSDMQRGVKNPVAQSSSTPQAEQDDDSQAPGSGRKGSVIHVRSSDANSGRRASQAEGDAPTASAAHPSTTGASDDNKNPTRGDQGERKGFSDALDAFPIKKPKKTTFVDEEDVPKAVSIRNSISRLDTVSSDAGLVKKRVSLAGKSLFVLKSTNCFRVKLSNLVQHRYFENTILIFILVSSLLLAIDNPLYDPNSGIVTFLYVSDVILTTIFTVEAVLKIIAYGFLLHKNAYLRSAWNVLDFVIVIVSILALSASDSGGLKSLRSLRALRALRPLRMIARWPGLRLVVNALFASVKAILNVLFVCVLFFMIFGIVGVNYFKGSFNHCAELEAEDYHIQTLVTYPVKPSALDASMTNYLNSSGYLSTYEHLSERPASAPTSKQVCEMFGLSWEPAISQNFDNILNAMGTLFEMSTTEGWVNIMYAGVDSRGPDMQPIRDYAEGWSFFFVAFMVVGSFFVMNLFVGVVIDNFNTMKERLGGSAFLTESQRLWVKTQEVMLKFKPKPQIPPPTNPCRRSCFNIANSRKFDVFIMSCIVLNTIVMAMSFFGEPDAYR